MASLSNDELPPSYDIEIIFGSGFLGIFDTESDLVIPLEKIQEAVPNAQLKMIGAGMVIHVTDDNLDEVIDSIFAHIQQACPTHPYGEVGRKEIQTV